MWNHKIYVATEADGLDTTNLVMVMEVDPTRITSENEFEQAVMAACKEYCLTDEGKRVYEGNCNCFNWGDLDTYVPNEICEKYGFRKILSNVAGEFNFDQQLVSEEEIFPEIAQIRAVHIKWDVDDPKDADFLPDIVILPDEFLDYEEDEYADEIGDWLSNQYGFCHAGFTLVHMTNEDLLQEEEALMKAIHNAGIDALNDFLGFEFDSNTMDIQAEMNDVLAGLPDEEYLTYLTKYLPKE